MTDLLVSSCIASRNISSSTMDVTNELTASNVIAGSLDSYSDTTLSIGVSENSVKQINIGNSKTQTSTISIGSKNGSIILNGPVELGTTGVNQNSLGYMYSCDIEIGELSDTSTNGNIIAQITILVPGIYIFDFYCISNTSSVDYMVFDGYSYGYSYAKDTEDRGNASYHASKCIKCRLDSIYSLEYLGNASTINGYFQATRIG